MHFRLWHHVTESLKSSKLEKATEAKHKVIFSKIFIFAFCFKCSLQAIHAKLFLLLSSWNKDNAMKHKNALRVELNGNPGFVFTCLRFIVKTNKNSFQDFFNISLLKLAKSSPK